MVLLLAAVPARGEDNDAAAESTRVVDRELLDAAGLGSDDAGPDLDAARAVVELAAEGDGFVVPDLSRLVAEPVHGVASSGFGWRDDPIRHRARFHCGADYRAPRGTAVYAAARGVVLYRGRRGGYGRLIVLDHGDGVATRYAHLQTIGVAVGQQVGADEQIGAVGSSGRTTGAHLHFEVRIAGRAVDPGMAERVGRLQGSAPPDVVWTAAQALRPELQAHRVSPLDPPRRRGRSDGKRHEPVRVRRRLNVS